MTENITWKTEQRRLWDLIGWDKNPRFLSDKAAQEIGTSIKKFGLAAPLVINLDNTMLGGHQRKKVIGDPDLIVDVRVPSRLLTLEEAEELSIRLNRNVADWDFEKLGADFNIGDLLDWGFDESEIGVVKPIDYRDLDDELEELDGLDDVFITVTVPAKYEEEILEFLANGESKTGPGLGKGVMKRCGLL